MTVTMTNDSGNKIKSDPETVTVNPECDIGPYSGWRPAMEWMQSRKDTLKRHISNAAHVVPYYSDTAAALEASFEKM